MLKLRMKKVLAVLLAVLFVTSLSAVAVSARGGGGHHGGWGGWGGPWYGGYGYGPGYPVGYYPSVASVGVDLASPVVISDAVVPVVTTSTVAASPLVVASEPGILTTPIATGFGYGAGLGLYPGLGYGNLYGGWGYGNYHGRFHHR
jgi:hypothetical protein